MSLIYVIITDCNRKPGWFRIAWRYILLHQQWLVPKTLTLSYTLRDIKNESGRRVEGYQKREWKESWRI